MGSVDITPLVSASGCFQSGSCTKSKIICNGKFSTQQRLPQVDCWVTNPHSIPADVDGDGDMDFVVSSPTGGTGNWDDRFKAKVLGGWIENQDGKFYFRPYTHPKARGHVQRLKY